MLNEGEMTCPDCGGDGVWPDHSAGCESEQCAEDCPTPYPCFKCRGDGFIAVMEVLAGEV